jgi:hypothetical protein
MTEFFLELIDMRILSDAKSARHGEIWSEQEDEFLVKAFLGGAPYPAIADYLQRAYTAILGRLVAKASASLFH